jgi:DNA-binding MarR family transcriptional regulator
MFEQISKDLYLSPYKGRKVLKGLLDKQFIEVSRHETDKRKYVYAITREGKVKLDSCFFQVMKNVQETYDHLDEEVMKNLIECMNYISKNMYNNVSR